MRAWCAFCRRLIAAAYLPIAFALLSENVASRVPELRELFNYDAETCRERLRIVALTGRDDVEVAIATSFGIFGLTLADSRE